MVRAALSIGPTRGSTIVSGIPRRFVVPRGSALRTSLPAPLGRDEGTITCNTIAVAASSRCGPVAAAVSRDGSPVTAAAVRGTLAERRLVIAGVPDLSALAGTRAGTIGVTLSIRKRKE
jgi:hypothetical protein